jgi:hypothetical protein
MLPKQVPKALIDWRVSSYSDNGSNCVEVRVAADTVDVRDTKDRDGGQLAVGAVAWQAAIGLLRQA